MGASLLSNLKGMTKLSQHGLRHRSLYTWKSVSSLWEEFFLQDESSFENNTVTKPLVTQATTSHQMKDMDIIFPLIPLSFLWVWILQPLKVQHFFRIIKTAGNWPFLKSSDTPFFGPFFQNAGIWRKIEIFEWSQSQVKLKILNFQIMKEAYSYL